MYIASIPNRDSPPAIFLREGYRENGNVKTRTLANLSELPGEAIAVLRQVLKGKQMVKAHTFLCMLTYYVEWHMTEAWRPLLVADEDQERKASRDPVAPAERSRGHSRKFIASNSPTVLPPIPSARCWTISHASWATAAAALASDRRHLPLRWRPPNPQQQRALNLLQSTRT
jgi:hypothetical protein